MDEVHPCIFKLYYCSNKLLSKFGKGEEIKCIVLCKASPSEVSGHRAQCQRQCTGQFFRGYEAGGKCGKNICVIIFTEVSGEQMALTDESTLTIMWHWRPSVISDLCPCCSHQSGGYFVQNWCVRLEWYLLVSIFDSARKFHWLQKSEITVCITPLFGINKLAYKCTELLSYISLVWSKLRLIPIMWTVI